MADKRNGIGGYCVLCSGATQTSSAPTPLFGELYARGNTQCDNVRVEPGNEDTDVAVEIRTTTPPPPPAPHATQHD